MGAFNFIDMNTIIKVIIITVLFLSCKKEEIKTKGIEFYLPENPTNIINCKDFNFNTPVLQSTPIIADKDIINYNWEIHEITISQDAYIKLKNHRDKTLPIYPLVLTLNGERIYGLFYKFAILAMGCETTLIGESGWGNIPKDGGENFSIVHGQVYDRSTLGKDPRSDKRIYDYLKSTGRLME